MTGLDQERLDRLAALADAATRGPWEVKHRHVYCTPADDERHGLGLEVNGPPEASNRGRFALGADARFIAAARDGVPWLLGVVQQLRDENANVIGSLELAVEERDTFLDERNALRTENANLLLSMEDARRAVDANHRELMRKLDAAGGETGDKQ